jgi:hypothetical protein
MNKLKPGLYQIGDGIYRILYSKKYGASITLVRMVQTVFPLRRK